MKWINSAGVLWYYSHPFKSFVLLVFFFLAPPSFLLHITRRYSSPKSWSQTVFSHRESLGAALFLVHLCSTVEKYKVSRQARSQRRGGETYILGWSAYYFLIIKIIIFKIQREWDMFDNWVVIYQVCAANALLNLESIFLA